MDIPVKSNTTLAIYADDTAIFSTNRNYKYAIIAVQKHLNDVVKWCDHWRLSINVDKTQCIPFTRSNNFSIYNRLKIKDTELPYTNFVTYLGLTLDRKMSWIKHINDLRCKTEMVCGALWNLMSSQLVTTKIKYMVYSQLIRSFITYGASSWSAASEHVLQKMQRKENTVLRRLVGATMYNTNREIKLYLNHVDLIEHIQNVREKELQKLSLITGK